MESAENIVPLAVALGVGLLIGLERGWHERASEEGRRVAGVRTFALIGLLGGVLGVVGGASGGGLAAALIIAVGLAALAAVLVTGYVISSRRATDVGVTSLVAGLLTFGFGVAAGLGFLAEAAMAAVVTALLLGYKSVLHRWVSALEPDELRATLKLLAISVVVLPVLPNRGYGPWDAINPFQIWWMVVLIAGISFIGYFAMKVAGRGRGAIITGLFAGLASSTALTLHFARLARRDKRGTSVLAAGILVACGTMFPRMVVVASIIHPPLFAALLAPAAVMAAIVYGAAGLFWRSQRAATADNQPAGLSNPLDIGSALLFGGLLALVIVAARGLESEFGQTGILAVAAISGVSDVDAITLTVADLARGGLAGSEVALAAAGLAIVLAGAVNTLVKGAMALAIGGKALGLRTALPLALASAAGLLTVWLVGVPDLRWT